MPANLLPRSDASTSDHLKYLVDTEGANLADPDWLGMLATLGISKGQPFKPEVRTREILDRAAKTAYKTSRVIAFEETPGNRHLCVGPQLLSSNDTGRPSPGSCSFPQGSL